MKKILFSSLVALAVLSGCHAGKSYHHQDNMKVVKFNGINDPKYVVTLSSKDNFDTAVLVDNKGHKSHVKNAVTASGVRMANDDGVDITFKRGEGILTLEKGGEEIFLRYDE